MFHISHFSLWWCIFHLWAGLSKGSTDTTAWLQIPGGWIRLRITMDAKMHSLNTAVNPKNPRPKNPTYTNKVRRNSQRLMAECLKLVAILLTELLSSLCSLLHVRLACYSSFHHLSRSNKSRGPPGSQPLWSTRSPTLPFLPSFQPDFETAWIPTLLVANITNRKFYPIESLFEAVEPIVTGQSILGEVHGVRHVWRCV